MRHPEAGYYARQRREQYEKERKQEQRARVGFALWGCLAVLMSMFVFGVVIWAIIRLVLEYT